MGTRQQRTNGDELGEEKYQQPSYRCPNGERFGRKRLHWFGDCLCHW
jgi:hypothetical protein